MEQFTPTWKLKDLIEDIGSFEYICEQFCPELPTKYNNDNNIIIYRLIFNKYCQSSVGFDRSCEFKQQFANIIYEEYDYFVSKLDLIKQIRAMTVNEMVKEYETITNVANNDNQVVESPLSQIIPYITTQSSSSSKINKVIALTRALREFRNNEVKYFLDKFKELFIQIIPYNRNYYRRGERD